MSAPVSTQLSNSLRHYFQNYATFTGRTTREQFWPTALFNAGLSLISSILNAIGAASAYNAGHVTALSILATLFYITFCIWGLVLAIPGLAAQIRRLHDTGRSGWWWLLVLTGIGIIPLIVFWCDKTQPGTNEYGPAPTA